MCEKQYVKKDILYVGGSDFRLNLFENLFPIPQGVSYNSYLILDQQTCLLDTVDASVKDEFIERVEAGLSGRNLDYLVIHHLEPDHSAVIMDVIKQYPNVTLVLNAKSNMMMKQFIGELEDCHFLIVKENDELNLGCHCLRFIMAPMVHWPEVMVSYDKKDKILFSADAFGAFGGLTGNLFNDEIRLDEAFYREARRYYANIVGKYGMPVQTLLKKASALEIEMICPLHGPIWKNQLHEIIHRYQLWSQYEAESLDVIIVYGSMYHHTERACIEIANRLANRGIKNVQLYDVSQVDVSYLIGEVFRVKNIVLACPTYNGGLYPKMSTFIEDMIQLNVSNKNFGFIENGSWAPMANKKMKELLSCLRNVCFMEHELRIETTLKQNDREALDQFVMELSQIINAK